MPLPPVRKDSSSRSSPTGTRTDSGAIQTSRKTRATPVNLRQPRRRIQFPQELIDHIIDCLGDQQKNLAKCASVSRAFVRRCQYHIFSKIILYPSLEDKFQALLKMSPHLAAYVRELTVVISAALPVQPSPLVDVLPLLKQVRNLNIKTYGGGLVDWRCDVAPPLRNALASIFTSNRLQEFVLQDIQYFDPSLPRHSPALRVLVLGGEATLAPFPSESATNTCAITPPELSVLLIGTGSTSFPSLLRCCQLPSAAFSLNNLQWLGLREIPGHSWISGFNALARTSLFRLVHLVMELEVKREDRRPELKDSPIDLSHLRNLTSIELRNNVYDDDQTPFSERVAPILQSVSRPSNLVQIAFYCPGYEFATFMSPSSAAQWGAVDRALSISDNPKLKQIHFKFGVNIVPRNPNLLPWVSSRGVVTRVSRMIRA